MSAILNIFNKLNQNIEANRPTSTQEGDIERTIELCEQGIILLPMYMKETEEPPGQLLCRDVLLRSYLTTDQFELAREAVASVYKAGAYTSIQHEKAIRGIDDTEAARNALAEVLIKTPGIPIEEAEQQVTGAVSSSLKWYLTHSRVLEKKTENGVTRVWLPEQLMDQSHTDPSLLKVAIVDVETTGMSKEEDEVVELGLIVCLVNNQTGEVEKVLTELNNLNEPSFSIPPGVTRVHGITDDDVRGKSLDHPKIELLLEQSDLIVAHNASFDRGFVSRYFPFVKNKPWHCSVKGVNWKQYGFVSKKLISLCQAHGLAQTQSHRALDDVKLTLGLLQQTNPEGTPYFLELLDKEIQFSDKKRAY